MSSSSGQELSTTSTVAIGAAVGAATFAAWLVYWLKTNMSGIEGRSAGFGEKVAEAAVKNYLAERFGLTPERLGNIRRLVTALRGGRS